MLGGIVGSLAALPVLRARRVSGFAAVLAIAAAWLGVVYGAKLQHRLGRLPILEALVFSPRELLAPGFNLPLGLLCGWLFATLSCLTLGIGWRDVGDALAVTAATMIPIGRVGCVLNGCCTGVVCGRWAPFCWRYAAGDTVVWVHPLPVYFGTGALFILAVLLWQLRRKAVPGTLLATAFFFWAPLQLALEPLRTERLGRSPQLMALTLAGMMLVGGTLLWAARRRAEARRAAAGTGTYPSPRRS